MGIFTSFKGLFSAPSVDKVHTASGSDQNVSVLVAKTKSYCVKCRTKREMLNPVQTTLKNGRKATRGVCPVCGTTMFRIGG